MTDIEEYVCPLSEFAKTVAKEELREDDETRIFVLKQMRDWIQKNPRILHCRTGMNLLYFTIYDCIYTRTFYTV